ncbi:hypothetical protein [Sporosarcina sp. P34]|uniref:hypothetical protein n=1 Tax=Sporosarcina sp. P34 TaxID=2048247 RepID=UPI001E2FD20F|nr:hypothetical protein [Sporosarcina sp. P34]
MKNQSHLFFLLYVVDVLEPYNYACPCAIHHSKRHQKFVNNLNERFIQVATPSAKTD